MEWEAPHGGSAWALPSLDWKLLALFVGLKLLLHGLTANAYGYFRDELYFLDCARHMSWGYVDDAPMISGAFKAALWVGGSLPAIRMIAAAAGAAKVALAMLLAREMGGRRFAQGLAGLCILAAPISLAIDSILNASGLEALFWMGLVFFLIRLVRTGNSRNWIGAGLMAGLGLETKYSMLTVLLALLIALLLTPQRRELGKRWFWMGAGLMVLLFLPTLLWQARHGFPLIEDMVSIRRIGKNVELAPLAFLKQQVLFLNPLLFPVWLAGLVSLLRNRRLRLLGWLYLALLAVMVKLHAKDYYLAAIYPMLFAAGGVAFEAWFEKREWGLWPKLAIAAPIVAMTAWLLPALLPFLPPEQLYAYQVRMGLKGQKTEVRHESALEQRLADQFGWQEMAAEVARIYRSLPPEERARTAIYAANYGEAGAINQFGPALGLPQAICAHQAHSLWGTPAFTGDTFICLGESREGLERACASVEQVGEHRHPWGMGEENNAIYLARELKRPLAEMWPGMKHWD